MLVLSRKVGEKIMIGDDIVITVVEIDQGRMRLGIQAPKNVKIMRQELILNGEENKYANPNEKGTA